MEKNNPQRKFLIATHGTFAAGIKSSLDIIIGAMDNVFLIQAYVDENIQVETQIKEVLEQLNDEDELIVFSDIMGGSITNQVLQHLLGPNVHVVSGFNLPLVIDILLSDTATPAEEVINTSIENAREQMVYVNKLLATQNTSADND
ncbi:MAG TPA: PTS sugar transporter subunit IIA [Mucilaginibacter sp.]|jgi:fructoselysine and glucoselysine-specific PTS system IIA component